MVKLASPIVTKTTGIVCLDSDVFFLNRVTCDDFYTADGLLHLIEEEEDDSKWFDDSWCFLGVSNKCKRYYNYIFMLVPFHRQVLLDLQSFIASRYDTHWAEAIVRGCVTEYMTYGIFARYVNHLNLLAPTGSTMCFTYWPGMEGSIKTNFKGQIKKCHAKAASIQSSIGWPVSVYRPLIEQVWAVSGLAQ